MPIAGCSSSCQPAPRPTSTRPAAHLVDRGHDLGKRPGQPVGDRRDERPEPDRARLAGDPGQDGPGIGRGQVVGTREALVVVGAEERPEPGRLGPLGDGELLGVGDPLLGLEHDRERIEQVLLGWPA